MTTWNIEIRAVGNGYIVQPAADLSRGTMTPISDMRVFESFDSMAAYLRTMLPIYPPLGIPPRDP